MEDETKTYFLDQEILSASEGGYIHLYFVAVILNLVLLKRICWSKFFTAHMHLSTPNHKFLEVVDCEAITSTTIVDKCCVAGSLEGMRSSS